eukprot:4420578-Heterocapsa_arctica.AAC.1
MVSEDKKTTFTQTFKDKKGDIEGAGSYKANYVGRRSKDEAERGTNITTLNVSGSLQDFEWVLENTEDHIVLIQEHWRLPNEIEAWKSAAYRKGWTG